MIVALVNYIYIKSINAINAINAQNDRLSVIKLKITVTWSHCIKSHCLTIYIHFRARIHPPALSANYALSKTLQRLGGGKEMK